MPKFELWVIIALLLIVLGVVSGSALDALVTFLLILLLKGLFSISEKWGE